MITDGERRDIMNMQNPYEENLENVLEKYGRDIVDSVKAGKIDPVIGRDDEVRSITRILSRKTNKIIFLLNALKNLQIGYSKKYI